MKWVSFSGIVGSKTQWMICANFLELRGQSASLMRTSTRCEGSCSRSINSAILFKTNICRPPCTFPQCLGLCSGARRTGSQIAVEFEEATTASILLFASLLFIAKFKFHIERIIQHPASFALNICIPLSKFGDSQEVRGRCPVDSSIINSKIRPILMTLMLTDIQQLQVRAACLCSCLSNQLTLEIRCPICPLS